MHPSRSSGRGSRAARRASLFGTRAGEGGLRAAAIRGSRWSILQQLGARFTSVLVFLVLARLLPPHAFGIVGLATVFLSLLGVLVEGGFGQAIVQRRDLLPGHVDTVFWSSVGMGAVLSLGLAGSSWALAGLYHEPELGPVLRVLALALFIGALGAAQGALLKRNLRFKPLAIRSVASNVLGGAVGLATAALGWGVWALVMQYLASSVAQTALLWVASGWWPGFEVSGRYFRDIFKFSRNSLGNSLLGFTNQRSDDFLVGTWLGAVALGIYSVAYRLLYVMYDVVSQVILTVALPIFSRLQGDPDRLSRAYQSVLRVGAAIAFPSYLFFAVASMNVTRLVFGSKWDAAAPVMSILAVFGALQSTLAITDSCLIASGRPHVSFRYRLANTVVQLIGFSIAAPFGITWVAASLVARAYLMAPLPVWALKRAGLITVEQWLRTLIAPGLSALVMVAALWGLRQALPAAWSPLLGVVVLVLAGAATYLAALRVLDKQLLLESVQLLRRGSGRHAVHPGRGLGRPLPRPGAGA